MHTWRINTLTQELSKEATPLSWEQLGGRGLIARILLDEVPPKCDPLGSHNKLLLCPGLLVGHMISSCDRLSTGGKSPLTGGVKESNSGGITAHALTHLGIKSLILEDQPGENDLHILYIDRDGIRFDPADAVRGMGVYKTAQFLLEKYGKTVSITLIGPAGERKYLASGIMNLDKDRVPSRINARGGLGALMRSKGLKAIVIDPKGGIKPPLVDPTGFYHAQKKFTKSLLDHPQTAIYRDFSTAGVARMCNAFGALPTRGFSSGTFEGIENLSGEHFRQTILERKGDPSHACMPGCTIRCSNTFVDLNGNSIVAPLEYETLGLMGSNLGISNLDIVAKMNFEANDLGLDTIDTGAALGIAARAGLVDFGDSEGFLKLMDEIRRDTTLGRILGNGAAYAGKSLGIKQIPVVKNQALSAYDPRAIKGTGITYATSPQGGDHTAGLTIRAKVDHLNPEGQMMLSRNAQINMAGYDSLGACIFSGFGFSVVPDVIPAMIKARYGWTVSENFLQDIGKETIRLERAFNSLAGFTSRDDRLPDWMCEERLPPTDSVFDVSDNDLDEVFNW